MKKLGIHKIQNGSYFLASRETYDIDGGSSWANPMYFEVMKVSNGRLIDIWILAFTEDGISSELIQTTGVRPVFHLKEDIKITGGDGTKDNPYTLGI